ncbi:unnamed protein product [Brassica rapa subsp. trilocularis]|uniref:(rape) hypothetical protein n=1 Tax=Brassica napus TaxID=3708 RepID=A0A816WEM7_BRANA|nr:unnamed protein product [Brassica napus]
MYELSFFDVTRSNHHFKLCNSFVSIHLNKSRRLLKWTWSAGNDKI